MEVPSRLELSDPAQGAFDLGRLEQSAEAEELLLRLTLTVPADPANPALVARRYLQIGQLDLARAYAVRAVALGATGAQVGNVLDVIAEAVDDAAPVATSGIYSARLAEGWLTLARLERAEGRLVAAVQHARRAADIAPHAAAVYCELAIVLDQALLPDHAAAALAIGLELAPEDPVLQGLCDTVLPKALRAGNQADDQEKIETDPG